ncbi:MAG: dTDP-4-dehydrorhamnose 3,5-epimerase [Candidatus Spechtbacterales bacterium]
MQVEPTDIPDVLLITPQIFGDERGFFVETYNKKHYEEAGVAVDFVQDNLSKSKRGVLRGLHYQAPPFAQGKLVSVVQGRVLDVAVDIRTGSPTFGKHIAVELTDQTKQQLWIPEGFAHAFLTLEDDTIFAYKTTNFYAPDHDRGILWSDSDIGIDWPLNDPTLSEKDRVLPRLNTIHSEFTYPAS